MRVLDFLFVCLNAIALGEPWIQSTVKEQIFVSTQLEQTSEPLLLGFMCSVSNAHLQICVLLLSLILRYGSLSVSCFVLHKVEALRCEHSCFQLSQIQTSVHFYSSLFSFPTSQYDVSLLALHLMLSAIFLKNLSYLWFHDSPHYGFSSQKVHFGGRSVVTIFSVSVNETPGSIPCPFFFSRNFYPLTHSFGFIYNEDG